MICFGNSGIFGAGGRTGRLIFTFGMSDGRGGSVGGSGSTGRSGISKSIFRFNPMAGGCGRFGIWIRSILWGENLKLGSTISSQRSRWERSTVRFGSLIFGIGSGSNEIPEQRKLSLQVYWS